MSDTLISIGGTMIAVGLLVIVATAFHSVGALNPLGIALPIGAALVYWGTKIAPA